MSARRTKIDSNLKIFSGNANRALAQQICDFLSIPVGKMNLSAFSDGELYCQILENVRGKDVFIIQPTCCPVNGNLMELLIMIDAFKRSSASRITAVIPYYGYGRQDRKDKPRVPISSKLVADLLTAAGANRILTTDLHAGQIQGFFNIPVDHLYAAPVLIEYLKKQNIPDLTVVSPDAGGVERARALAKRLDKAIRQAGGVPNPGGFPIAFTAWNDVALGRVVEHALELQRGVVAEIEQAAAGLQEHPAWPMIAQDALELARAHERRLAEAHGA